MRIKTLEIDGFRGFAGRSQFDLDADAIILVGQNGYGKTSILDAILWGLSGSLPRLGDDARLVSMYSESGEVKVGITLAKGESDQEIKVVRSFDGQDQRIRLDTSEKSYKGPAAQGMLIDMLWPDAASASDPSDTLATALTRGTYLQQDLVRQFVDSNDAQERFNAVSELVGVGRVSEFQVDLEKSKRRWTRTTNERDAELSELSIRITQMNARVADIRERLDGKQRLVSSGEWDQWRTDLNEVGISFGDIDIGSREASSKIDHSIRSLESARKSEERRIQNLRSLKEEVSKLSEFNPPDIKRSESHVRELSSIVNGLKEDVSSEQNRLTEHRRLQTTLKEKDEQVKALAKLALNHLGDHCPVCNQDYDIDATKERLNKIISSESEYSDELGSGQLEELLSKLEASEKQLILAENDLKTDAKSLNEYNQSREYLNSRLNEAGFLDVNMPDLVDKIEGAIDEAEFSLGKMSKLQQTGESLALRMVQSSDVALMDELTGELDKFESQYAELRKEVSERSKTGNLAQSVIEELRNATIELVSERIEEIGNLLQSIYARIDPHPAFRAVTLLTEIIRGRGHLNAIVSDPVDNIKCNYPASILSSSQLNALAISIFLSLNLGVPKPILSVAILDDPLQSMDDINLLGLVDFLRRTKDKRQLIVTTHDARFGSLLARKLRPGDDSSRTIVVSLRGWSRAGPIHDLHEIEKDPVALRLAAS